MLAFDLYGTLVDPVAIAGLVRTGVVLTSQMVPVSSPARWASSPAADCPGVIRVPSVKFRLNRSCRPPMRSGSWLRIQACMAVSTPPGR